MRRGVVVGVGRWMIGWPLCFGVSGEGVACVCAVPFSFIWDPEDQETIAYAAFDITAKCVFGVILINGHAAVAEEARVPHTVPAREKKVAFVMGGFVRSMPGI